jgi:hypothetical protein
MNAGRARSPDDNGRAYESLFFADLADKPFSIAIYIARYIIQFVFPMILGSYDVIMGITFMVVPTWSWREFAGKSMRGLFEEFKNDPDFLEELNERRDGGREGGREGGRDGDREGRPDTVGPADEGDDGINPLDKIILP